MKMPLSREKQAEYMRKRREAQKVNVIPKTDSVIPNSVNPAVNPVIPKQAQGVNPVNQSVIPKCVNPVQPKARVHLHCDNKVRDLYTGQVIEW